MVPSARRLRGRGERDRGADAAARVRHAAPGAGPGPGPAVRGAVGADLGAGGRHRRRPEPARPVRAGRRCPARSRSWRCRWCCAGCSAAPVSEDAPGVRGQLHAEPGQRGAGLHRAGRVRVLQLRAAAHRRTGRPALALAIAAAMVFVAFGLMIVRRDVASQAIGLLLAGERDLAGRAGGRRRAAADPGDGVPVRPAGRGGRVRRC